jgi:hypothetical protein
MRPARRPFGACFALAIALSTSGCFFDPEPGDFNPLPGRPGDPAEYRCPELDGQTYDLATTPLARELFERAPPETHGLPVVLSLRDNAGTIEPWWVVPRAALLEHAAQLRANDPERYARWRDLVLRGTLPAPREWDALGYRSELATLGPPARVFAGFRASQCAGGWMRVTNRGTEHVGGRTFQVDWWIARDASGDLLVRRQVSSLKQFSSWGGNVGHLRTGSDSTWSRYPPVEPVSPDPLVDADLPRAPRGTRGAWPVDAPPDCSHLPDRLVEFSQGLQHDLPVGVELSRFMPENVEATQRRDCRSISIELAFDGGPPEALAGADLAVRRQRGVLDLDLLPTDGASPLRRRLRILLQADP